MAYGAESKYYEDFEIGERFTSANRTVTETDIVNFAGISGDFNPLHMDEEFAKTTIHGGKIAHGALLFAMSTGLFNQIGFSDGSTQIANLGLNGLDYKRPVKPGDTIHIEIEVTSKRVTHNVGRGIVEFDVGTLNQRGEVVMLARWKIMFKTRNFTS
ncbi:MAG: MaoC/PaaZ C-terminal domain-containing protein [Bryobacteraceae bacterium]|nr:MaoC/PaaZ C-terminal domain-containing protein [Bryobacteraceae bacterium]